MLEPFICANYEMKFVRWLLYVSANLLVRKYSQTFVDSKLKASFAHTCLTLNFSLISLIFKFKWSVYSTNKIIITTRCRDKLWGYSRRALGSCTELRRRRGRAGTHSWNIYFSQNWFFLRLLKTKLLRFWKVWSPSKRIFMWHC
jgi:hypothetical protein